MQARSEDDGFYYYYWFNITFDFQCQNSAGQLCVVPSETTLHKFCSKYVSVVQEIHSMWFYLSLLYFFFFFLNYSGSE